MRAAAAWSSTLAGRLPSGTKWCISCARFGLHTPAEGELDGDPLCTGCGLRIAAQSGDPFTEYSSRSAPTPAPAVTSEPEPPVSAPDVQAVEPEVKEEMPVKLTEQQIQEIHDAGDDVSNADLARKFGCTDVTIGYHRRKAPKKAAPAKRSGAKREVTAPAEAAPRKRGAQVTLSLSLELTHDRADEVWAKFTLEQKADAIRGFLQTQLEQA